MQSVPKIVLERLKAAQPAVNHPDADLLTAFAEQSLPAAERATVLQHLARCGDCRDVVALASPATETLEIAAASAHRTWLTWPVLRWGFVAAGVVVIASLGFLQYQHRAAQSTMAYKSPEVTVPESRLQTSAPAAGAPAPPAAKQIQQQETATTSAPADFLTSNGAAIPEPKRIAPPSASRGNAFRGAARSVFGGTTGGPKPSAQFQFNNNVQQQTSNNGLSLPVVNQPANQPSSARQRPTATERVDVSGAAPTVDTEIASRQATRDQSADADANSPAVAKAKLPVPLAAPGQIGGYVVDPTGAVVSNARITITPPTGGTATAVTDSQGTWLIAGLPTGNYKARAEAPGFNTAILDLNYDANQPSTYRFTLSPGSVSETVEVTSAQSQLQTEVTSVGGPITNREGLQAPVNGRNFTQLASMSTGPLPRWNISAAGTLQRSFDQGSTWQNVDVNATVGAATTLEVVAKASHAKEKDADKKALKQQATTPTFRVVAAAGSEVWAGGSGAALYHSLDAGGHWTRVAPTSAGAVLTGDVLTLEFPDPQHGKVTTSTPEVWTTSDAGQTWQKQ